MKVSSIISISKMYYPEVPCPMQTRGVHLMFLKRYLITEVKDFYLEKVVCKYNSVNKKQTTVSTERTKYTSNG